MAAEKKPAGPTQVDAIVHRDKRTYIPTADSTLAVLNDMVHGCYSSSTASQNASTSPSGITVTKIANRPTRAPRPMYTLTPGSSV